MVGSAKSVADVYVKSVKPTYAGLEKFLYKAYGLTDQQRKVLAFKKYRSLKLKPQATVSDVKIFLANWELYSSELESLKISFDEIQKIIDFMNALPIDVRRFISLQPKEVELMALEEVGILVKRFCEQTYGSENKEQSQTGLVSTASSFTSRSVTTENNSSSSNAHYATKGGRAPIRCYRCQKVPVLPVAVGDSECVAKDELVNDPIEEGNNSSVGDTEIRVCVDTGASRSLITERTLQNVGASGAVKIETVEKFAKPEVRKPCISVIRFYKELFLSNCLWMMVISLLLYVRPKGQSQANTESGSGCISSTPTGMPSSRAGAILEAYDEKLDLYEKKGYVRKTELSELKHLIPHQCVFKPGATSSKIRPVWDAKASELNHFLMAAEATSSNKDLLKNTWMDDVGCFGRTSQERDDKLCEVRRYLQDVYQEFNELKYAFLIKPNTKVNFNNFNFLTLRSVKYASLYFVCSIDRDDNELIALETIHLYVETLDRYFGNVCELDVIFNFHKAQYILDELLIAGELQESSKRAVLRAISAEDELETVSTLLCERALSFAKCHQGVVDEISCRSFHATGHWEPWRMDIGAWIWEPGPHIHDTYLCHGQEERQCPVDIVKSKSGTAELLVEELSRNL
ncbi:clathrin coat assembly protein ap19, putative [Perkinsus marinus ATCC 50983]|uniref:Clathrin coat assembly protein ap19, putative n=1 Tax=Perkinsus marinus (strain ATCC 50983 / TXsc) TaxID=423536 RepID=C5L9F9_PERM5|nr:clathrin coat assembly protein ap19, putative [Perkinsus marinus ATCC 50983]EER06640.1 clathrin coat assembly protein ap19, putative [Perkinsus marinus ATCC 50983]|eukprot:XP_002774824.1 clathrin coat assembly protein ap19, putative [Perkinsus marinus ATCC 50983]